MDERYIPLEDYAQSANTLFHFVTKDTYLQAALQRRALVPRYCTENIEYLELDGEPHQFSEIQVLQKCFCDIPFHKLADSFNVQGTGASFNSLSQSEKDEIGKHNTHFDYYGRYAISFSKKWGEKSGLQPIQYINTESNYSRYFSSAIKAALSADSILPAIEQDVLYRIAFSKPLRGIMHRRIKRTDGSSVDVEIYKNFHDECEWRYVPRFEELSDLRIQNIIANPKLMELANSINRRLEAEEYRRLWLEFEYDDIRYIVVPDAAARVKIIGTISDLPDSQFQQGESISIQKSILVSKILVLDEIRKDW